MRTPSRAIQNRNRSGQASGLRRLGIAHDVDNDSEGILNDGARELDGIDRLGRASSDGEGSDESDGER